MALFNYASKEITLKVVYYGPGLCGKTTNLQKLHETMATDKKGKLLSLSTDADRTLFFDFMPVQLGKIKDFNIRFQLYTVPGQVRYNATRKLVLKGADAVVFVADSQKAMKDANLESFQNMKENLIANNINPDEIPVVLQYNKRDLKNIAAVDEMNKDLNSRGEDIVEASAYEGWGVDETFKLITKRLLKFISKKHNVQIAEPDEIAAAPAAKKPEPTQPKPAPAAPAAPAAKDKSKIQISVKDAAEDILKEGSDDPMSWGDVSMPAAPEPASDEISFADVAAPTAEDIFAGTSGGADTSQLEQALAGEGDLSEADAAAELMSQAYDMSAPDIADYNTQMLNDILDAVNETKRAQAEMLNILTRMEKGLRMLVNATVPKGPVKK